ncbi:hypothetical protein Tco_0129738, partial [Tanacetum coccineum]
KLKPKGDIGFFIGYSKTGRGYRIYIKRTNKVMETINIKSDELSKMAYEQRSLDPALQHKPSLTLSQEPKLQHKTSRNISPGLVFNQALSTITLDKPSKSDLDHLFEMMYDDYMGNQPDVQQTGPSTPFFAAPLPQNLNTPSASTTIEHQAPTPTNSFADLTNTASTPGNVDDQVQQEDETHHDDNALWNDDAFVNPYGTPSMESIETSSCSFDHSNMHTFYQLYPL